MYQIILTHRALRDLSTLDKDVQNRIKNKLMEYSQDPLKYARKLIHPKIGTYRFKIGHYRMIFDLVNCDIIILRLGHRKDIYK